MSEHVTIELSEQVAPRAESVARLSHRRVEDVLAELLERAVEELPVDLSEALTWTVERTS